MTSSNNDISVNGKAKDALFRSMELIMKNLQTNMDHLNKPKYFKYTQEFIELIQDGVKNKRKFFLLASGRSAFIIQCFATRLVHLGAKPYIITNTRSNPAMHDKDILIILSGSGTTEIVVSLLQSYVNKVKPYGIVSITSHPKSVIGRMGDITIKLIGRSKRDPVKEIEDDDTAVLTPEGTAFEQVAFTYLDAIIAELATRLGRTNADMEREHAVAE